MVKCIICGKTAAEEIGICKGCMREAQKVGVSISIEHDVEDFLIAYDEKGITKNIRKSMK